MVKEIPLQNGMVALVDDEDFERVNKYVWSFTFPDDSESTIEITTKVGETRVNLKRYILGLKKSIKIITVNGNGFDCRKENLSIANSKRVSIKTKGRRGTSSKYKGVSWVKSIKKWESRITNNGKKYHLGYFEDEDDAAEAYNKSAIFFFGEGCYLNILGEDNNVKTVNAENLIQTRKKSSTGFKGVLFIKENKYRSVLWLKKKCIHLGYFVTSDIAAKAYDQKAYELYGDKAILNFPHLIDEYKTNLKGANQKC